MSPTGIIFDIKRYAVHDGPGIRTTVFLKGCPMSCWWCHNPESQKPSIEQIEKRVKMSDSNELIVKETIGQKMAVKEVMAEVEKDRIFYDESNGGVTFSGGEPLYQAEFLKALLIASKRKGFHTAVDTAGCAPKAVLKEILPYTDLFLYDIKLIDKAKHLKFTGYSNEEILENLQYLSTQKKKIIVRIPVIPTVNTTKDEITAIGEFLMKQTIQRVELLPYHKIGEEKYTKLQKINQMKEIAPPTKEKLQQIQKQLEQFNLEVQIEE